MQIVHFTYLVISKYVCKLVVFVMGLSNQIASNIICSEIKIRIKKYDHIFPFFRVVFRFLALTTDYSAQSPQSRVYNNCCSDHRPLTMKLTNSTDLYKRIGYKMYIFAYFILTYYISIGSVWILSDLNVPVDV